MYVRTLPTDRRDPLADGRFVTLLALAVTRARAAAPLASPPDVRVYADVATNRGGTR